MHPDKPDGRQLVFIVVERGQQRPVTPNTNHNVGMIVVQLKAPLSKLLPELRRNCAGCPPRICINSNLHGLPPVLPVLKRMLGFLDVLPDTRHLIIK